jgi:hypothetical protein
MLVKFWALVSRLFDCTRADTMTLEKLISRMSVKFGPPISLPVVLTKSHSFVDDGRHDSL